MNNFDDVDPFSTPNPPHIPNPNTGSANGPAAAGAAGAAGLMYPCPCSCGCGNDTDMAYAALENLTLALTLRCGPCAEAGHHNRPATQPGTPAPSNESTITVRGERTGTTVVIHDTTVEDAEDVEWNNQIRVKLENERRAKARDAWLETLPPLWTRQEEGEPLTPQVNERLTRWAQGHRNGTSLLCAGPYGAGKTWVAYSYARAAVDQHLVWPQQIRAGLEAEILEPVALCSRWDLPKRAAELLTPGLEMLVIDDVGTMTHCDESSRWAAYTKIVNWMYENDRTLVLTMNKNPDELKAWVGKTAYERIRHMVGNDQVVRAGDRRSKFAELWEAEYQSTKVDPNPSR